MTTSQDTNWTLYYVRSNSQAGRFYKVLVYQGRCYACECKGNRLGKKQCCHIAKVKAGEVQPARMKRPVPTRRPVVIVEERHPEAFYRLDVG